MTINTNKPQSTSPPFKRMLPQVEILQMMNADRFSQNILVVAQLEIADLLADRPRSVVDIAQETQVVHNHHTAY